MATNRRFAESLGLDYPILSDPDQQVARAYGVLNAEGPQRWTFYIGKDGRILFIDKLVNAQTHGPQIAIKLRELGVAARAAGP